MEAARRTHATAIAARTRIMSTPSGAYKIWRHPHLKFVDKCLQYVVWLTMRLDKLDSVAKLAGPEGATARRRFEQFNAGAAARFAAKHWTTMAERLWTMNAVVVNMLAMRWTAPTRGAVSDNIPRPAWQ